MTGGLVAMKAGPLFGLPVDVLTPVEEKFIPVVCGNTPHNPGKGRQWAPPVQVIAGWTTILQGK